MPETSAPRFALRPRTLVVVLLLVMIVAGVAVWFYVNQPLPGTVKLVELPEEATATVSFAGMFPAETEDPLANPLGIAWDGSTLYVAESDAARITLFDLSGGRLGSIDLGAIEATVPVYPSAIAVTDDGRLALVDNSMNRVLVVPSAPSEAPDVLLTLEGTAKAPMRPTAVAYAEGEFYVFDAAASCIRVYSAEGDPVRTIGTELQPALSVASGLCVFDGALFVADSTGGRVVKLSAATGAQIEVFPDRYSLPRSVTPGPGSGVAVADTFERTIYVASATGERLDVIDAETVPDGLLSSPRDVAWVPADGRLYVTDAGLGRVMVFNVGLEE